MDGNGGAFDPDAFDPDAFDTKAQLAQAQVNIRRTLGTAREATDAAKERLEQIHRDAVTAAKGAGDQSFQPNADLYPYLETQAKLTVTISESMERLLEIADASLTVQRAASEASAASDRRSFRLNVILIFLTAVLCLVTLVLAAPTIDGYLNPTPAPTQVPSESPSGVATPSPIATPRGT